MKSLQVISLRWLPALALALACLSAGAQQADPVLGSVRYPSSAFPGFDNEQDSTQPERKEPHWWWVLFGGPECETAAEQFAYGQQLAREGSDAAACRQLDALVRQWPTAPEAWQAQHLLADILLAKRDDPEEAFREYRYLLDFYSLQCDYQSVVDRLYEVAGILRSEGKALLFVRFANTVDVRRFYEMCVLRAPGAKWVPEALLTIASLREDEQRYVEAVQVYENLRNLHPDSPQAAEALAREARVRMTVLRDCTYNRARTADTIGYLRMALERCRQEDAEAIRAWLAEASELLENEAYRGAKFYDSTTRTRRSAISAYERYLAEYPDGAHADEIRARLSELKGSEP